MDDLMLRELIDVRQIPGEHHRRWFSSASEDLIVWCDCQQQPIGFQLCYNKGEMEHALTWLPHTGFSHMAVDDGEHDIHLGHKASPILIADGAPDIGHIRHFIILNEPALPEEIQHFITLKLSEYSE